MSSLARRSRPWGLACTVTTALALGALAAAQEQQNWEKQNSSKFRKHKAVGYKGSMPCKVWILFFN